MRRKTAGNAAGQIRTIGQTMPGLEGNMKYTACMNANEMEIRIEKEGIYAGSSFFDYAEISGIRPISHRIFLDLLNGETVEISMLGFSFDGFYEELIQCFGERSKEALFVEEELIMQCEGEYALPEDPAGSKEAGRCMIALYPEFFQVFRSFTSISKLLL